MHSCGPAELRSAATACDSAGALSRRRGLSARPNTIRIGLSLTGDSYQPSAVAMSFWTVVARAAVPPKVVAAAIVFLLAVR